MSEERIESKTVVCLLSDCVSTDVCLSGLLVIRAHINLSGSNHSKCFFQLPFRRACICRDVQCNKLLDSIKRIKTGIKFKKVQAHCFHYGYVLFGLNYLFLIVLLVSM